MEDVEERGGGGRAGVVEGWAQGAYLGVHGKTVGTFSVLLLCFISRVGGGRTLWHYTRFWPPASMTRIT